MVRFGVRLAVSLLAVGLAASPALAQLYWDGGVLNGGTVGPNADGGPGTWNNTLTNWDTLAAGGADSAWIPGGDAIISGAAGTITVDTVDVGSIFFANNGHTLSGGTITMTGAAPTIGVSFNDGATISSVIAGTNGLTTGGNGVLVLTGTNTFTGGLTVNSSLRLGGVNSANGANNVVRVTAGNTLLVTTSTAFGGDTAASRLVLESGSGLAISSSLTHDVTINSGGPAVISGGTWNGVVVGSGPTTVAFSSITVTGNLFDNGGVLSIDTATHGGVVTFTGNLSHTGGLTVGNATVLSGIKSYSGDTIVAGHSSGTSQLTYTTANAISASSNVVIGDADTIGLVQFGYTPAAITLGIAAGSSASTAMAASYQESAPWMWRSP